MRTPIRLVLLVLLLIPSAVYLARFPDLPRFGGQHDDTIYMVTAKALAEGQGYRIESLPDTPLQTKYPPLYPLLLSLAWRVNPEFPDNLRIAGWLTWLGFPVVLGLLLRLYPKMGFSQTQTWVMLALLAVNPYVIVFGSELLSEMLFLALALGALLLLQGEGQPSAKVLVSAGALVGLACLTRSAGTTLAAATFLYLWTSRGWRPAFIFAAGVAPFAGGWMLWSRLNATPTTDLAIAYYTDYVRNQFYGLSLTNFHLYLWKNAFSFLESLGGLIVPKVISSVFMNMLAQVVAVAMISGVVRMVRQGRAKLYALFGAVNAGLLLIVTFPTNERLVLPLFPLALAGLLVEMQHLSGLLRAGLRHKDRSQRIAAGGILGFAALGLAGVLGLQIFVGQVFMPQDAIAKRVRRAERVAAYEWARMNLPANATVLSSEDVLFYLHTGRHAMRRTLAPVLWYADDHPGIIDFMGNLAGFAESHGLQYLEFAGADRGQGLSEEDARGIEAGIRSSKDWDAVFPSSPTTIYKLRQPSVAGASLRE